MYSVVLMAALTSGTTAPDCFFRFHNRCGGVCYGSSCYGGACYGSSCYGSSCYGSSCYGSSCYGSSCYGGACYGCYGSWSSYSGWGCYGSSCYGSINCHGCYGCYGCYGCTGYMPVSPATGPAMPPAGEQLPEPKKEKKGSEASIPNRARLIVELPSDATLYIDDQPMKTTAGRRAFQTPDLERGQSYYYDLRAEVVREGQTITERKRVIVRPGDVVLTEFTKLDAISTAKAR